MAGDTKRGNRGEDDEEIDRAEAAGMEQKDKKTEYIGRDNGQIRDERQMAPRGTVKHT